MHSNASATAVARPNVCHFSLFAHCLSPWYGPLRQESSYRRCSRQSQAALTRLPQMLIVSTLMPPSFQMQWGGIHLAVAPAAAEVLWGPGSAAAGAAVPSSVTMVHLLLVCLLCLLQVFMACRASAMAFLAAAPAGTAAPEPLRW